MGAAPLLQSEASLLVHLLASSCLQQALLGYLPAYLSVCIPSHHPTMPPESCGLKRDADLIETPRASTVNRFGLHQGLPGFQV